MSLPATMRFIEVKQPGGPEAMAIGHGPIVRPGQGEVLIAVAAAGVNRADVSQRMGKYPPPAGASPILGLEVSGTIAACGDGVMSWQIGNAVCALVPGGGYAEYCVTPAAQCLPVPAGVKLVDAAGLPETFFTVWTNVFQRGKLGPGQSLLVHGGSSGVGTTAIQLARAFGNTVYVTAGTDEKCAECVKLGATAAINYRTSDFAEELPQLTAGQGVDVILDMVGGPYVEKNFKVLAVEGRLVEIAFMHGSRAELDLRPIIAKRLTLTGSSLRPLPSADKGRIAEELRARVWPLLDNGSIKPIIHKVFKLEDAPEAHRLMESSEHVGKILLVA